MRLTTARIAIAAFLLVTPSAAEAESQSFTLGRVDLLALAAAFPPEAKGTSTLPEQAPPMTYRALRAEVAFFLRNDVERVAGRAWWKIRVGQGQKASYPEIPRETDVVTRTVQESMSSKGSFYGEGWTGLLTGLGLVGLSTAVAGPPGLSEGGAVEARVCASLLENAAPKVRQFLTTLPDTEDPAPADVLANWAELTAGIRADRRCARMRGF